MIVVALDLETTGLDPDADQVLSIGAVICDLAVTPQNVEALPTFEAYLWHDRLSGSPIALGMNGQLIARIAKLEREPEMGAPLVFHDTAEAGWESEAWRALEAFLESHLPKGKRWVAAGKNVAGFDLRFFPDWLRARFHHRVVDPGSVFVDYADDAPPSLPELKQRFGLGDEVAHDAVEDARDVLRVLLTRTA